MESITDTVKTDYNNEFREGENSQLSIHADIRTLTAWKSKFQNFLLDNNFTADQKSELRDTLGMISNDDLLKASLHLGGRFTQEMKDTVIANQK